MISIKNDSALKKISPNRLLFLTLEFNLGDQSDGLAVFSFQVCKDQTTKTKIATTKTTTKTTTKIATKTTTMKTQQ